MKIIRYISLILLVSAPLLAATGNTDITQTTPTTTEPQAAPTSPVKANDSRYVIVDAQKVIGTTKIDQEPVQELIKLKQNLEKEITDLREDLQKEAAALKVKASTLSPEAFKKKQEELEEKAQKAQLKEQRANKQLEEEGMKVRYQVFQELQKFTQQMVDESNSIDIVFEKSGGILAYSKRVDGSDELGKRISKEMAKKETAKKKAQEPKNSVSKKEVNKSEAPKAVATTA